MKPPPSPFQSDDTLPPPAPGVNARSSRRHATIIDVGGATAQGRRRERNEDAWGYRTGHAVVVADGMGGRPNGDVAAHAVVEALTQALAGDVLDWRTPVADANQAVRRATAALGLDEQPGGAVAVALRCVDDRTSIVHVGDARAYRLRDGLAEPLTRDHSVAETMAELGVHRSTAGLEPKQLASLTTFFGEPGSSDEFTVRELTVRSGDRVVLCTDGCYSTLSPANWASVADIELAGDAARHLVDIAVAAKARDDATAVVIDLDFRHDPDIDQGSNP